jgi:tetratricopeptide (TPR) repeat protein
MQSVRTAAFVAFSLLAAASPGQGQSGTAGETPEQLAVEARRYAETGQLDRAIATYERSFALMNGPLPEGIDRRSAARWKVYEPIVRFNLATLNAARGIDFFQAGILDLAAASFRTSLEWNPHSRDVRYNLCQALYIEASRKKDQGEAAGDLAPLFAEIVAEAVRVRDADPANANLLLILGHTYRGLDEQEKAEALLAEHAGLPFEISRVRMDVGASETTLSGVLRNLKLATGDVVRLRFTMLALDGRAMARADVEVTAREVGEDAAFAVRIGTTEDVAGWRYELVDGR